LSVLIAAAFAAPHDVELDEALTEIEKAQMQYYNPMMRNPWMTHNNDQFPIDYSEKDKLKVCDC
jgi:hypothetical protein